MTATPAEGQTPEPKTVPEYLQEQQLEWGVYVASGVIDINGVRAFNPGDPVPTSHVKNDVIPGHLVEKKKG